MWQGSNFRKTLTNHISGTKNLREEQIQGITATDLFKIAFFFTICTLKTLNVEICSSVNLLLLCGYKTWSLKFYEARRLRVINKTVLMKGLGPNQEELREGWKKTS